MAQAESSMNTALAKRSRNGEPTEPRSESRPILFSSLGRLRKRPQMFTVWSLIWQSPT